MLGTMALNIGQDKTIFFANKSLGVGVIKPEAIILATGCRERTRGAINIPGTRPTGVFTAGLVQEMINMKGYIPGKEIIILGSGDIGLIMARRLTLEGCRVKGVYELMPYSTGLMRNIYQCLNDYNIPLYLSLTVTNIFGNKKIEAIEIAKVDTNLKPVIKRREKITCDTLILSVGLIPENEISKTCGVKIDSTTGGPIINECFMTSVEGIFSCGNSLFVNDIVDNVTTESYIAAENAVSYIQNKEKLDSAILIKGSSGIGSILPQRISGKYDVRFRIRSNSCFKVGKIMINGTGFIKSKNSITPGKIEFLTIKKKDFEKYNLLSKKEIVFKIIEK